MKIVKLILAQFMLITIPSHADTADCSDLIRTEFAALKMNESTPHQNTDRHITYTRREKLTDISLIFDKVKNRIIVNKIQDQKPIELKQVELTQNCSAKKITIVLNNEFATVTSKVCSKWIEQGQPDRLNPALRRLALTRSKNLDALIRTNCSNYFTDVQNERGQRAVQ